MRIAVWVCVLTALLLAASAKGQQQQNTPVTPPQLGELERLRIQVALQRLQIAQLRLEAAQREWEEARQALLARLKEVERDGYELDLETLAYRPKPKPPAPQPEKRDGKTGGTDKG
jgi:hypothetical protein